MENRMKEEAIYRMEKLGLMKSVIADFKRNGKLYYSERSPLGGILYWLDNEPELEKKVKELEKTYGFRVFHATHEYTEFGECLDLLIVSKYEEEWENDREMLDDGYVFSYVINLTTPWCSEFGDIAVKELAGGLVRI